MRRALADWWPWTARQVAPGMYRVGPWVPWRDRWVRRVVVAGAGAVAVWRVWAVAGLWFGLGAAVVGLWVWRVTR